MISKAKTAREQGEPFLRFGKRVRYLRLRAGHSQEELASLCSLDRTYVGGIERGERNPSLKNILLLANALMVPVAELFELNENENLE